MIVKNWMKKSQLLAIVAAMTGCMFSSVALAETSYDDAKVLDDDVTVEQTSDTSASDTTQVTDSQSVAQTTTDSLSPDYNSTSTVAAKSAAAVVSATTVASSSSEEFIPYNYPSTDCPTDDYGQYCNFDTPKGKYSCRIDFNHDEFVDCDEASIFAAKYPAKASASTPSSVSSSSSISNSSSDAYSAPPTYKADPDAYETQAATGMLFGLTIGWAGQKHVDAEEMEHGMTMSFDFGYKAKYLAFLMEIGFDYSSWTYDADHGVDWGYGITDDGYYFDYVTDREYSIKMVTFFAMPIIRGFLPLGEHFEPSIGFGAGYGYWTNYYSVDDKSYFSDGDSDSENVDNQTIDSHHTVALKVEANLLFRFGDAAIGISGFWMPLMKDNEIIVNTYGVTLDIGATF